MTFPVASVTGSASIGLRIVNPTGCPDSTRKVSIPPCPCCVPTANLRGTVTGCAPGATVSFDLDPTTPWHWPAGCTPQQLQATSFNLEVSSNGVTLYRAPRRASRSGSQDNAWVDFNTGNTGPIMLRPATGGTFTVGVGSGVERPDVRHQPGGSASFTVPSLLPTAHRALRLYLRQQPLLGRLRGHRGRQHRRRHIYVDLHRRLFNHQFISQHLWRMPSRRAPHSAGAVVTLTVTMRAQLPTAARLHDGDAERLYMPHVAVPTATVTGDA